MPIIIAVYGLLYIFFGAVIDKNNGFGYDGKYYGQIAMDFYNLVFNNQLTVYRIQRIFPSFLVNLILTVLNLPKENIFVVKVFQILNILLLICITLIWNKISKIYELDLRYIWLGFVLAIINYSIGEISFYYPVLTDTMAYFLGFCLLYFYLKENLTGKIIVTVIGSFTWASFVYFGLLLILLPLKLNPGIFRGMKDGGKYLKKYLAVLLPIPFIAVSVYQINNFFTSDKFFEDIYTPVFTNLLYVSAFLNYALLIYFLSVFLPERLSFTNIIIFIKNILSNIKLSNLLISVLLFGLVFLIQKQLSNSAAPESTFSKVFYYLAIYSVTKPMAYFVLAVTCCGPVFIMLFFFMKYYKPHLKKMGIGVYISFLLTFLMIFSTEPRLTINFFPFLVLLTVLVLRDLRISNKIMFALTVVSLILSKVYFPMYKVKLENLEYYRYFKFPYQLYFMNSFSISKFFYIAQGIFIAAVTLYLVIVIKKNYTLSKNNELTH